MDRHLIPSDGGPLVFVEDLSAPLLAPEDHHHLARVRRTRDGDPMVLGDGAGSWVRARMRGDTPEVVEEPVVAERSVPAVAVGFGLSKGAKPEWCVQKLTELGVDRIVPFAAGRSVVRWDASRSESATARLAKVAREAAMQSRSPWVPVVEAVTDWTDVAGREGACRAERGGAPPSLSHPLVLVGPEGGWTEEESRAPIPEVSLGQSVLRAETAAITAGVVLTALRAGLVRPGS
ncbi:MAG: 16S rRNA (uracil(1498)-N(3))-methyltransferase [Acidimicrobiales bacterium]|nr:16S rRNA (uracil(1498)-N(3))-methyltransferase [Acidimicrobiales bacterium]